jgi:hypothetical protein
MRFKIGGNVYIVFLSLNRRCSLYVVHWQCTCTVHACTCMYMIYVCICTCTCIIEMYLPDSSVGNLFMCVCNGYLLHEAVDINYAMNKQTMMIISLC